MFCSCFRSGVEQSTTVFGMQTEPNCGWRLVSSQGMEYLSGVDCIFISLVPHRMKRSFPIFLVQFNDDDCERTSWWL